MTDKELEAMNAAESAAKQTPPVVRTAFLTGPITVGGHTLQPFSLGHLWTLEAIEHPLIAIATAQSAEVKLGVRDLCSALFVLAKPREARLAIAEGGRERFDLVAGEFAESIAASDLPKIAAAIIKLVTEGLATAPSGDGAARPPA
jgi:hypothetical protein